jgi:hypothetical protein
MGDCCGADAVGKILDSQSIKKFRENQQLRAAAFPGGWKCGESLIAFRVKDENL